LDSDGDGVPDYLDECPGTPEGVIVDCKGCPLDGDGVYDSFDKCPGTPQGALVDEDGCWTIGDTLFDFDKYNIKTEYHSILDQVVTVFERNPSLKAEIQGHTDNFGTRAYNQVLSNRRAQAVVNYLVQGGVDRAWIHPMGYDFSQPRASNETAEGRALNRRVEIRPVQ
ncbi:MAG: OmpA family protein, partial [Deltaproteobacteria bacterium]|nr:OmpA family protein [Deltaproteobacteria bacterium]